MISLDNENGDILIQGFEQGIGDSPYTGLTDMRNINTVSIPGEADINFATIQSSFSPLTGSVTSASGATINVTVSSGTIQTDQAVVFSGGSLPSGITAGVTYWVLQLSGSSMQIYSNPSLTTLITTGGTGTGTFASVNMGTPIHWTYQVQTNTALAYSNFILDNNGRVWQNPNGTNIWEFLGNSLQTDSAYANGLVWYEGVNPAPLSSGFSGHIVSASGSTITYSIVSGVLENLDMVVFSGISLPTGVTAGTSYWIGNLAYGTSNTFTLYADPGLTTPVVTTGTGTGAIALYTNSNNQGYLFLFRGSAIDYYGIGEGNWVYNWWPANPLLTVATPYLNSPYNAGNSHFALVAQDNAIYYCDGAFIGSILQLFPNYPFDPSNTATYTWNSQALSLPTQDCATWLAELGQNLLISGVRNYIYPWDRTVYVGANGATYTSFSTPILVAEPNTTRMITVNTNTYIFAGNRGRIYITNGSQAQLWKKIPDHLSGTIEPYYTWGAIGYSQNQLYFGFQETSNTGAALPSGGLWAVDVNTQAIRVANELSYGTFNGYASVFIPNPPQGPTATPGNAFYVGWYNGTTGGVDISSSAPYVGNSASGTYAYVISDMIPVGTAIQPMTAQQFEYKLSSPLLFGESVEIQVGSSLADFANNTFTSVGITQGSGSTVILSDIFTANLQEQQWILVKCILQGISSNTSYCRLVQLRIKGATLKLTGYFAQQ